MENLTPSEAGRFAEILEKTFPWIGADGEVVVTVAIQQIIHLHMELAKRSRQ